MIGRYIDRAALTVLSATGLYLFFLNAGFGIAVSCVLAFACMWLIERGIRRYPWRQPYTRRQADAALYAIAEMGEDEAKRALTALARRTDGYVIPLQRHPDTELSAGEVYALWQAHRDCEQLIVTVNAGVSAMAAHLAETLDHPAVRVVDKHALISIIRKTGRYVPDRPRRVPVLTRVRRAWSAFSRRRASPRMLLTGFSLLGMYLLLGRGAYLVAAIATLSVAGALWINNGLRWRGSA